MLSVVQRVLLQTHADAMEHFKEGSSGEGGPEGGPLMDVRRILSHIRSQVGRRRIVCCQELDSGPDIRCLFVRFFAA